MSFLDEALPETSTAFEQVQNSIFKDGYLDLKTKELIAVTSSVIMRCQLCIEAHSQKAEAAGATKEDIAEAVFVAVLITADSQIGWTKASIENIYDRIFEKDREEEGCCCCCGD